MSFTETERPTTGGGRAYKLTDDEVQAIVKIIKRGKAATSDPVKSRKLAQARAHAARHQIAQALEVDPEDLKSSTAVADEAKDLYTYSLFQVN